MKRFALLLLLACLAQLAYASHSPSTSTSHFDSFPEGKRAAFYLSFDDGCVSQIKNVFPRLEKYRIHGTFYVCPEWKMFKDHEQEWATTNRYVHLGNHSYTHGAITNVAILAKELADCNREILRIGWDKTWPRDIAWGIPGTETIQKLVKGITDEEVKRIYSENHVVERLPYFGYPVNCKTIQEMEAYIDRIAAEGGVGHLDFHGVGGDWLDPGLEYFEAMLKRLDSHRDVIWFAPWPEIHKVMCQGK